MGETNNPPPAQPAPRVPPVTPEYDPIKRDKDPGHTKTR
jgi:hypothetical protein